MRKNEREDNKKKLIDTIIVTDKNGNIQEMQSDGAAIVLGGEEEISTSARARGFSEDAIKALLSGKIVFQNMEETPFGTLIEESWEGKKDKKD